MYTSFSKEAWATFRSQERPGSIHMLNLIRLHGQSQYPDGRTTTGSQAYAEYGRISAPVLERLGGRIVWRGKFEMMVVGPDSENWDICFIAEYPSVSAFVEMMRDPTYREAMTHRQVAVADSRLVRMMPMASGFGFANPIVNDE
jgi:uncharacterized protein (DUF1330 family)